MDKTAKKKSTSRVDKSEKLIKSYKEHVLLNGTRPASVFKFMHDLKMPEAEFYNYFASFNALEKAVWNGYINSTIEALHNDEVYASYSVREKLLSFYFSLIEILKGDRSFVQQTFDHTRKSPVTPPFLTGFKDSYKSYVQELVVEGFENEEIVKRPIVGDKYHDGLWLQLMFVINFWLKDDSQSFENTDAAIEKSVNLSFELMGRGPLDMMIDFAKFLYHNK